MIPTETLGVPDNTTDTLDTLYTNDDENNDGEVEIYGSEPIHKQVYSRRYVQAYMRAYVRTYICTYVCTYVCTYLHMFNVFTEQLICYLLIHLYPD